MHAKSLAPNETNVFNMCANADFVCGYKMLRVLKSRSIK